MLDLLKKKKTNQKLKQSSNDLPKHYPSSVREWNNSIYFYNKNHLNLIPHTTKYALNIIKSFFYFWNNSLEKKIRTKRLIVRLRRLSSNRIYLSNGEFKHKNKHVLINIYLFNRQRYNYIYKFKNIFLKNFFTKKSPKLYIKILKSIFLKGLQNLCKLNKNKYLLIKRLNLVNKKYKINTIKSLSNYTNIFYKRLLKLTMKKLRLYFLYKQLIYLNKSKFNYTYLRLLKKHLEYLYNKNVEFNLVNLKRFYLNSDILSESVRLKITRNRKNMSRIIKKMKNKVNIKQKGIFLENKFFTKTKTNENKLNMLNNSKFLNYIILNNLKYKHVTGFRLETAGRLSRRFTASRSQSKLVNKGSLLDISSSYDGTSSVILKGNLKSNIQYTKIRSKTRIGSFGIKGWVSSN